VELFGIRCVGVFDVDGQWWKKYWFGTLEIFVANILWLRLRKLVAGITRIKYIMLMETIIKTSFGIEVIIRYILFECRVF
jgi:hypothetical protein